VTSWVPIVSGTLIGAASGIGGAVIGAWMNGKSQLTALKLGINAENYRIRLADKRNLYALFTVRVNEMAAAIHDYSHRDDKSNSRLESDRNDLAAAARSAVHAVNEIYLVAPRDVGDAVPELYEYLESLYKMAYGGKRGIPLPDEKVLNLSEKIAGGNA